MNDQVTYRQKNDNCDTSDESSEGVRRFRDGSGQRLGFDHQSDRRSAEIRIEKNYHKAKQAKTVLANDITLLLKSQFALATELMNKRRQKTERGREITMI